MYVSTVYNNSVTYVSSYTILKETPHYTQSCPDDWSPECILDLLKTGIQLCMYITPETTYDHIFKRWECEYPNFRVMAYRIEYTDTWIHKECNKIAGLELPSARNVVKDTYEYLVYMHSRAELMEDAISENPWNSTHFAWIDFNLAKLFHKKETHDWLSILGQRWYAPKIMAVPGCWEKYNETTLANVTKSIHWRFCGAFMLGDIDSVLDFVAKYRKHFPEFLQQHKILTWEVNFWAWMEYMEYWKPTWYRGDHNDTILYMSADIYTVGLSNVFCRREVYNYASIPTYYPGSASYLNYNGLHILNTRYVNYWIYPNGYYLFHNPKSIIENKNILSFLDAQTLTPINYVEMQNVFLDVHGQELEQTHLEKAAFSEGFEDIRLYMNGSRIRFICTNVNFSPTGRNRIIVGTYNIEHRIFQDCVKVHPPIADSWCEKNWIPLVDSRGEEWFVYKWSPMELGKIDPATNKLDILRSYKLNIGLFTKVRGSSTFIDWIDPDYLVGVVHFSEEHMPRHYYHMLVLLEKETFKPVKYTNTFYFEHLAIEFCIGMALREDKYCFWISQFDRDPMFVTVELNQLPFVFDIQCTNI